MVALLLIVLGVAFYRRGPGRASAPAVAELKEFIDARHDGGPLAFSSDGKYLALSRHEDGKVEVWGLSTREVRVLDSSIYTGATAAGRVVFSSDGRLLAVRHPGTGASVWNLSAKKEQAHIRVSQPRWVYDMAFTDNDRALVAIIPSVTDEDRKAGRKNCSAVHWDSSTGKEQASHVLDPFLRFKALSPDGRYAVFQEKDAAQAVFDLRTGDRVSSIDAFGGFRFSRDGSILVSYSGKRICLWDVRSGKQLKQFALKSSYLTPGYEDADRICLSPDNKMLAVGMFTEINRVGLISLESGEVLATFECCPPQMFCSEVRFAPDGRVLATDTDSTNIKDQHVQPLLRFWKIPASW